MKVLNQILFLGENRSESVSPKLGNPEMITFERQVGGWPSQSLCSPTYLLMVSVELLTVKVPSLNNEVLNLCLSLIVVNVEMLDFRDEELLKACSKPHCRNGRTIV